MDARQSEQSARAVSALIASETTPRIAYRVLAPAGLALIAIQQLRKRRLRRRIGLRVARARRQPTQLYPMQQP